MLGTPSSGYDSHATPNTTPASTFVSAVLICIGTSRPVSAPRRCALVTLLMLEVDVTLNVTPVLSPVDWAEV